MAHPSPDRTPEGFPVIRVEQAHRDAEQTSQQVRDLMTRARSRLYVGTPDDVKAAAEHIEQARAALDWLADRIAITEGGPLARTRDTPSAE